jgi:nitrile hydratase beta subunit
VNSAHDVGGMHGFGAVPYEESEIKFDEDWERLIFGLMMGIECIGEVTIDEARYTVERMGNSRYLSTSYYEKWVIALESLLLEKGMVTEDELRDRIQQFRDDSDAFSPPPLEAGDETARLFADLVESGAPSLREIGQEPKFEIGDEVATRLTQPAGHTRLPRYARGKRGTIVSYHGCHVLPDANAHGLGECPEPLYTVRFDATELWGDSGGSGDVIHLDLWESYLKVGSKENAA